ncbi:MAG: nicotinamide riboside transporter PnuC [Streptosporangiales bacterium]|nr:nicotinamide riboside transporter PnuC [Streptosporangiales bacterium]
MTPWSEAGFQLFGQHVLFTDLVGNVFALATVWLAKRRTIWAWPVQLAGSVLLFAASMTAGLGGNAMKQVLFAVLATYGWWRWARGMRGGTELQVRPATPRERTVLIGVLVVGTVLVAWAFDHFDASWAPLPDAYIFVGSAVATFGQSRALVDFWLVWVAVDLVGVPLAIQGGLWVTAAVYGVFFVMVIAGFRDWLARYRQRSLTQEEAVSP